MPEKPPSIDELMAQVAALRRETEELAGLREELRMYQAVVDNAQEAILVLQNGRVVFHNAMAEEILGWPAEELDIELPRILHPDDREMVRKRYWDRLAGQDVPQNYDFRIVDRQGKTRWMWVTAVVIKWKNEPATLVLLVDITSRKEVEAELRQANQVMQALLSNSPLAVVVLDADGLVLRWVGAAEHIFGWSEAEVLGKPNPIVPRDKWGLFLQTHRQVMAGKLVLQKEVRHVRKDGSLIESSLNLAPVLDQGGEVIAAMGLIENITERKQAEGELIHYQKQLKRLASQLSLAEERERRRLAEGLHGSLGQLLAVAQIKLTTLEQEAQTPRARRTARATLAIIEQAIHVVRSLTLELGSPVLYELGFEAALEWLAEHMGTNNDLTVELEVPGDPLSLDGDLLGLLFRGSRELLLNVVKHAGAGRAWVKVRREGPEVVVSVRDDGRGFSRQGVSFSIAENGGFGLFNLRERLEYLGGRFQIESSLGRGTLAIMRAPLSDAEQRSEFHGHQHNPGG